MQDAAELEMALACMRWEVNTLAKPHPTKPMHSSKFRFQGNEWRLQFHYANNQHVLRLVQTEECLIAPFVSVVRVEGSGTQRILAQLCEIQDVESIGCGGCYLRGENNDSCGIWLWKKSDVDIQQAHPELDRDYFKLRFLVILEKRDALTDLARQFASSTGTSSRAMQTECGVPEVAGQSNNAISTSAPTTLLSKAMPCLYILSQDLAQLMVEDSQHDVKFLCAGKSIKAHKLIVCRRSPVIAFMLASHMVEGRTGVVTIPDMRPDIFAQFIGYVYCGQLKDLTFEVALRLFEAGDRYAVHGLAKRCCEYLVKQLSSDNAYEMLLVADAHSNKEFVEKVVDYMVVNRLPLVSQEWPAFSEEHPKLAIKILSSALKASMK